MVDIAFMGQDKLLVVEEDCIYLMMLDGHVVWQSSGFSGIRDVDAVMADAILICLADKVLLMNLNGTTLLEYAVDDPLDAEYEEGKLYIATKDTVLVVEDGTVVATYSCSPTDIEVRDGKIFVVEGTTIRILNDPSWSFEC